MTIEVETVERAMRVGDRGGLGGIIASNRGHADAHNLDRRPSNAALRTETLPQPEQLHLSCGTREMPVRAPLMITAIASVCQSTRLPQLMLSLITAGSRQSDVGQDQHDPAATDRAVAERCFCYASGDVQVHHGDHSTRNVENSFTISVLTLQLFGFLRFDFLSPPH